MASTPLPPSLVKAFASIGARNAIPVAPTITPGQASFDLGFPPITMPDPPADGIPPDGKDMNGILNMISAHTAWVAAGGCYPFNQDVVDIVGGYGIGAILQSATHPEKFFQNTVASNVHNPDVDTTGWLVYSPVGGAISVQAYTMPPGTTSDFALNLGVGFLDLNPTTGAADLTGIAATNVTDGQQVIVTNLNGANFVTLHANSGSSAPTSRFRLPADITLPQYANITLKHSTALGLWVPVS